MRDGALTFALIFALLFAQGLGLLHRSAHGAEGAPPHSHLQALFDLHDEGSPECRLHHQLSSGDLLPSALAASFAHALPVAPPLARIAANLRAAEPAPFLARAPPPHL